MNIRNRIIPVLAVVVLGSAACSADESPAGLAKEPAKPLATKAPSSAKAPPQDGLEPKPKSETQAAALTSTAPARPSSLFDHALAPEHALPARLTKKAEPSEAQNAAMEDADGFREVTPADVNVTRFVLATDVSDREPLGESVVFPADTPKIFAFLQLDNQGEPYEVSVHFESADGPRLPYGIDLEVKTSPRWRTWAYTRVRREPGMYRAVVRTLDGQDIASQDFEVSEAQ